MNKKRYIQPVLYIPLTKPCSWDKVSKGFTVWEGDSMKPLYPDDKCNGNDLDRTYICPPFVSG